MITRILLFFLLFLPSFAFGQLYGTGVGYVNGTPSHTPNIAQKGSEICISINNKMLYTWNRDSSEWKPVGGITVTFGAPISAPAASGGTRTAINMQNGLIYWWNGSAWKEIIAYSVELANVYSAAVAELYANQVRAELADSTATLRNYADSLHLADNDRDSTNELQNLVLLGTVLNITDGNAVDFATLLSAYVLKTDTTALLGAYVTTAGFGLLKSGKTLRVDSSKVATKYYADALHAADGDKSSTNEIQTLFFDAPTGTLDISGGNAVSLLGLLNGYATGSGTPTRLAIWTGSGVLGDSPITYNSTTKRTTWTSPGVIELPMGNDAQRPTVPTTSDFWYGVTGPEWFNGLRWAKALESTANTIPSGRVIYTDINGQATGNSAVTISGGTLNATTFVGNGMQLYGNAQFFNGSVMQFFNAANTANASFQFANSYNLLTISRGIVITDINPNLPGGPISANWPASNMSINGGRGTGNSTSGDIVFSTANAVGSGNTVQALTNKWWIKHTTGRLSNNTAPNYILDVQGTDAIGIPRGNTGNQPSIVSGTTPLRFFTDTSALAYGDGGVYNFIATRPYVRALMSGLSTTWLKTELEALRDVTINGGSTTDFRIQNTRTQFDGKFKVGVDSSFQHDPATNATIIDGSIVVNNLTGFNLNATGTYAPAINFNNAAQANASVYIGYNLTSDFGGYTNSKGFAWGIAPYSDKINYQWSMLTRWDSVAIDGWASDMIYGANFTRSSHYFRGGASAIRGGEFNFLTRAPVGSTPSFRVYNGVVDYFSVLTGGQIIGKNRLTGAVFFLADPVGDSILIDGRIRFKKYGTSATTAATLGETESGYLASFAVGGKIVSRPDHTERYHTITSTSSPQTLSSTIADNLINQGSTQSTFTLNLPASPVDGQVCTITYNNAINTLTIDGNGNSIIGSAVTTAVAGSQRKFKYYAGIGWIKIY